MTVWLVDPPSLAHTLNRAPYVALAERIQVLLQLIPVIERERFAELIAHALKAVGCQHTLLADSGMELLRQASQGLPRQGRTHPENRYAVGRSQRLKSSS